MEQKNKLVIYVLSLYFLIFIHFWFPSVGITGLGIQQNNITWLWLCITISIIIYGIAIEKKVYLPQFWKTGSYALLIAIFPLLLTSNQSQINYGIYLLVGLVLGWVSLLILYQSNAIKRNPILILLLISLSGFIQSIWGIFEVISISLNNSIIENNVVPNIAEGVFNQRNVLASYIVTGFVCGCIVKLAGERSQYTNSKVFSVFLCLYAFLVGVILYFNMSRAGSIGLLLGWLCLLPLIIKRKSLLCGSTILVALIGVGFASYLSGFIGVLDKEISSGGARLGYYYTSFVAILDSPLLGHGLGSFERVFVDSFAELHQQGLLVKGSDYHGNLSHPHNELLYWGVQGGFVSILGLLTFIFILTYHINIKSTVALFKIAALIPIVLHSMVEMPFYQSSIHFLLLLLLYVLMIRLDLGVIGSKVKESTIIVRKTASFKFLSIVLCLSSTAFLGLNIYSLNRLNEFVYEGQEVEKIETIPVNFGWDDTFQYFYRSALLRYGSEYFCRSYINWAEQAIDTAPKLDYYRNIVMAYDCLNNKDMALKYLSALEYYYPTHKKTQDWVRIYRNKL